MSDPTATDPVSQDLDAQQLSEALVKARKTRTPIAPLTDSYPELSVKDAYAIAAFGVQADIEAGANPVGHKIGLTSKVVQRQLGVDTPDYGSLLDDMWLPSGAVIDIGDYIAPRIELELAFRLGTTLRGPNVTADDVRRATATVHPAIELVDSRICDWRIKLADTVADRGSAAAFVIGEAGMTLDELDVSQVRVELQSNGKVLETGRSDAVLGNPCAAVAWLANALAEVGGALEAGQLVLSGACTKMATVVPGDDYRALFDGLGELSLRVAR